MCLAFIFSSTIYGQSPNFLDRLKNSSELIVEGKVVDKYCLEDTDSGNIYTINMVEVSKHLSGHFNNNFVGIKTRGGQVDGRSQVLSHSPSLTIGQNGIFFLSNLEQSKYGTIGELSLGASSIIQYFENDIDYEAVHRGVNIKYKSRKLVKTLLQEEIAPVILNLNHDSEICLAIGDIRPNGSIMICVGRQK